MSPCFHAYAENLNAFPWSVRHYHSSNLILKGCIVACPVCSIEESKFNGKNCLWHLTEYPHQL